MEKLNLRQWAIFCILLFLTFPVLSKAEVNKVRVILENSYVRLKPEIDSMILAAVPVGTELEMAEEAGEWFKVKLPPDEEGFVVTGYIHSSMVEVIIETKAEEKPTVQSVKEVVPPEKPASQQPIIYRDKRRRTSGTEFGLTLLGSGSYFYPDDINDTFKTMIDYWNEKADKNPDSTFQGVYKPLNIGYGGGVEAFLNFIPQFGIGVGVGYIFASTRMNYNYDYNANEGQEETVSQKISALPITFSLHFGVPLGNVVKIFAKGGVEYYLAKYDWSQIVSGNIFDTTIDLVTDYRMKGNNVGFYGGLGLELSLSPLFAFVIEAAGRYARLMDIQGTSTKKYFRNGEIYRDDFYENLFLWHGEFERD